MDEPRILVVGAGLGGLSFAAAWARAGGRAAEVIERGATSVAGAAGIGLHPNAQRALDACGVLADLRPLAMAMDDYTPAWGTPTWAVHRADLLEVMTRAVPAGLRYGVAVVDLKIRDDRKVDVRFSDGSSGSYDLVIGADGVRSSVRSSAFGDGFVRYGGACFWRTTLSQRIVDETFGCLAGSAMVALRPLVGERTHVFVQVFAEEPIADSVDGRVARLRERLAGHSEIIDAMIDLLDEDADVHFGLLEWVEPPRWGTPPVLLIGDAAHAMAPTLALGGAMALEDGVVLAEELLACTDIDAAAERFISRREPRVAFVQRRTALALARFAGSPDPTEPDDPVERMKLDFRPLLQPA